MPGFQVSQRTMKREVAVYKGDDLLAMGTVEEVAKELDILPYSVYFYSTPTYKRRGYKNARMTVFLDEEDEE